MFRINCLQVRSPCLLDPSLCSSLFGHAPHILIRKVDRLLLCRLARISCPSLSHFCPSMAFFAFFVTSLERSAILTWRISGNGRQRLCAEDLPPSSSPRRTYKTHLLTPFMPSVLLFLCECFIITSSASTMGDHNTTTQRLPEKEGRFVLHIQISASSAASHPIQHPVCVGSESKSICPW